MAARLVGFVAFLVYLNLLLKPLCLVTITKSILSINIIISTGSITVGITFDTGTTKVETTQQTNKQLDASFAYIHTYVCVYIYIYLSLSLSVHTNTYISRCVYDI